MTGAVIYFLVTIAIFFVVLFGGAFYFRGPEWVAVSVMVGAAVLVMSGVLTLAFVSISESNRQMDACHNRGGVPHRGLCLDPDVLR